LVQYRELQLWGVVPENGIPNRKIRRRAIVSFAAGVHFAEGADGAGFLAVAGF